MLPARDALVEAARLDGSADVPAFASDHASHQIAQSPLQTLVPEDDVNIVIIAVILDSTVTDQVVTHSIAAKSVKSKERVHNVASRLGHFLMAKSPMGMSHDLFRQGQIKSKEKSGPVYAMKANDILSYYMNIRGPAGGVLSARRLEGIIGFSEIVDEGI